LLIFLVCFIGIVFWVYRRSGRKLYDKMARMPLEERGHDE
jgi:cbb3-type cytochrome oxidase subunit 3